MNLFFRIVFLVGLSASVGVLGHWLSERRKAPTPVTLYLMWEPQAQFLGYYAARDRGFFADEGIDIQIKHDLGFGESFHEILSQPNTYAINLLSNTIEWMSESPRIQAISVINRGCSIGWIGPFPKENLLSRMTKGEVYSWWGPQDILLKNMLIQRGIEIPDFNKRVQVGFPTTRKGDWIVLVMAYNELVDYMGFIDRETQFTSYCDLGQPFFEDILVSTEAENPQETETHRKMVRAVWKGWDWTRRNPEQALDLLMAIHPRRSRDIQDYQLTEYLKHLARPGDRTAGHREHVATVKNLIKNGLVHRPEHLDRLLSDLEKDSLLREVGL